MARIPQTFIDDLLARIDIVDIVDKRITLKKAGSNYSARCPFHNEKTPSFTVSARKQFYYCFGCGASGNAIGFLMQHDNFSFIEAIKQLAQQVGMTVPLDSNDDNHDARQPLYAILQRANQFYQQQLRQHAAADKVKTYLKERGLTGQIAKTFNLGFAPPGWDNLQRHLADISSEQLIACGLLIKNEKGQFYDRFRDRIIFPIRDRQGRVIGFGGRVMGDDIPKYLNSPETAIFHKGSELYGLYEALQINRQLEQMLVVEGYMDVIALAQHNITNVVATLGTATTKLNAERLFRQVTNVIFCFDGDAAGRTAAWRALENILPLLEDEFTIRFMFLPEGEDPDSLVRKLGRADFQQFVMQATPLSTFLLNHLSKATDLDSLEGRSRLAKLATPFLEQIPGEIFRESLIENLAARTHMDARQLRKLLKLAVHQKPTARPQIPQISKKPPSLMQRAISLLLQYPEAAKNLEIIEKYKKIELPGTQILTSLLDLLAIDPHLTTGALLEHWRNNERYSLLATLAMRQLEGMEKLTIEQITRELEDTLARLVFDSKEQKLSNLHAKYAAGELNQAEKLTYSALLTEQRTLTKK